MNRFIRRLNIAKRLVALVVLAVTTLSAALFASAWQSDRLTEQSQRAFVAKDVVADILPPPLYLIELRLTLSAAVEGLIDAETAAADVSRLVDEYESRVRHWRANPPYGLEKNLLGLQHMHAQHLIAAAQAMLPSLRRGDFEAARRQLIEVHQHFLAHREGVLMSVKSGNSLAEDSMAAFTATADASRRMQVCILLAALGLLSWLSAGLCRSITQPMKQAAVLAQRVGDGDLTGHLSRVDNGTDEVSQVLQSLSVTSRTLAGVVGGVVSHSARIADCSARIASGSCMLNNSASKQAAQLTQASACVGRMCSQVGETARAVSLMQAVADEAAAAADQGGKVVLQTVQTMREVADASSNVGSIVASIDAIAFQTNILALNAAVESARAGESGRGFAVVAAEVRALAKRCALAAGEIKSLASGSLERTEAGVQQVMIAQATLDNMARKVTALVDIAAGIGSSASEQGKVLKEIGSVVDELAELAADNQALASEHRASAEDLSQDAGGLVQLVSRFRLRSAPESTRIPVNDRPPRGAPSSTANEQHIGMARL